jgi:hypothetical protein
MIVSFQPEEALPHCFYCIAVVAEFNHDPSGSGSLISTVAALTNSEVASLFSREKFARSSVRRLKILLFETCKKPGVMIMFTQ